MTLLVIQTNGSSAVHAINVAQDDKGVERAERLFREAVDLAQARRFDAAHVRIEEAAGLWLSSGRRDRVAVALIEIAGLDRASGRWQDALRYYLMAKDSISPDGATAAVLFNSIGRVYLSLAQYHLAEKYCRRALDLSRRIGAGTIEIESLTGLARAALDQRDLARTGEWLERAGRLAGPAVDDGVRAEILLLTGLKDLELGRRGEAVGALESSLDLYGKSGDRVAALIALCHLSRAHLDGGDAARALERAEEAVRLAAILKSGETQWRSYLALARSQLALGRRSDAIKNYYRSYAMIEKQRAMHFSDEALRTAIMADRQAPYRELLDLRFEDGNLEEAYNILQFAHARSTSDTLAQLRVGRGGDKRQGEAGAARLSDLNERASGLRARLRLAEASGFNPELLRSELVEVEHLIEEARWVERRDTVFLGPITLEKTRKLLAGDAALVEFSLGDKRSLVWFITADAVICRSLPGQAEIEDLVGRYIAKLSVRPLNRRLTRDLSQLTDLGRQLYDLLLGPVAQSLSGVRKLIIVPDGRLHYLPFGTLVNEDGYLIESHEVIYEPSAGVLDIIQMDTRGIRPELDMELLALGDPVLSPTRGRQRGSGNRTQEDETMRGLWFLDRSYNLPPLPNTRHEVLRIGEMFPPRLTKALLTDEMTEESLRREPLDHYRRLHIATHSLIDEQSPSRSGILLSMDPKGTEDGFLDLAEISGLKLNCDLVVLSACQTGRGKLIRGEGVVGLTRAFLYAGARRVVVSLWNVGDLSTSEFMIGFYGELASGISTAEALRRKKLSLIRGSKATRHPHYWSSFILVGNPH